MYPQVCKRQGEKRITMDSSIRDRILPFSLTFLIIILDQTIKAIVVSKWPREGTFIKDVFNNDFLIFYHVRNKAIAFSLGDNIPDPFRFIFFVILPIVVLVFLTWYYLRTQDISRIQRWAIAGIIGGGVGNIIDRVFRKDGVVDFISVKFYGLLGMQRWPTFNVADASVVVCCLILLVTMLIPAKKT